MSHQLPPPMWEAPYPYGSVSAIESMGSVAAPLFAGFSVTIAFQVVTREQDLRWPDLALVLLLGATFALGASVQFTFRSRQYAIKPADIEVWFPNPTVWQRERMRQDQRLHRREYLTWSDRARLAYNIGLLAFLLGLGAALVPPGSVGFGRVVALSLVALAFGAELALVLRNNVPAFGSSRPIVLPEVEPLPTRARITTAATPSKRVSP